MLAGVTVMTVIHIQRSVKVVFFILKLGLGNALLVGSTESRLLSV